MYILEAQLIVCNKVNFDKSHSIDKVLNYINVDVFPSVVNVEVFIKLSEISSIETTDLALLVIDTENNILNNSPTFAVRNYRDSDQIPGVDLDMKVQLVLLKSGNVTFELYLNQEKVAKYPLTVRIV